uniref:Uncharacterized protein n=1 Tax=Anabas testudineus TaxID=64144 RepID=A0A3Q1HDQ0_ANATE
MRIEPLILRLGECVLTVQLDDEDAGEEVEFYLLFSGSTQRHVSSTLRVSHITLQAVCPAHNVCEEVLVTLCLARPGGSVDRHSQETFCFVQVTALSYSRQIFDLCVFCLCVFQIPLKECERLDQSLTLALKHLSLKLRGWWMYVSSTFLSVQLSSLLHLAASCGLRTVASFLLQQPGAREALRTTNTQGQTPACVAQGKGHEQLVELFRWLVLYQNLNHTIQYLIYLTGKLEHFVFYKIELEKYIFLSFCPLVVLPNSHHNFM